MTGTVNDVKDKSTEKACRDFGCLGETALLSLIITSGLLSEFQELSCAPKIAQALQSRALLSS